MRLLYEVKKQGSVFALLKAQFTSFKAVVNQRLRNHEKSAEFMTGKFDEFELQSDDFKRNIYLLWGKDHHKVKFANLYDRIDDLEQYSRINCLLFVGIEERDTKDTHALVLDVCNSELEVEVSLEDIERSHRLGARIRQQGRCRSKSKKTTKTQTYHSAI